ncbi:hypothetical protein N5853_02915 [Bartonella sp. HY329]|uniref:hypothetical protein n=1 Tax=unclassified Bartonella TaxID=2645622 RepID=UPI0021C82AAA|nr:MULTISPECIES: hypothetical protein [unclassified Bartonella]UXM95599.1 hypothetical protein N5853_02915 [Bartonella sp. HY329]UXN09924.1 hypothetical protein N5852_02925 [Bartonella sp. HY328]
MQQENPKIPFKKQQEYKLSTIIEAFAEPLRVDQDNYYDYNGFCLYCKVDADDLELDQLYYIDDYGDDDDDSNQDVYPEFITQNNLYFVCHGEAFINAMSMVLSEIEQPTLENFVDGINYYWNAG